jgi:hypothetical protein
MNFSLTVQVAPSPRRKAQGIQVDRTVQDRLAQVVANALDRNLFETDFRDRNEAERRLPLRPGGVLRGSICGHVSPS